MPNKPTQIICHHTAASYDKNPDQFEATRKYHISKGWGDIGYHYEISKGGKVYKGRDESMPGAHTKEQNVNYNSIGICLDGDFDKELPTKEQIESLKKLLQELMVKYKILPSNIFPHRHYAVLNGKPYKSCYGSKLPDDWARKLVETIVVNKPVYDEALTKRFEGKFLIAVEDKGKLYYVFEGKRRYVSPEGFYDFAKKFATGIINKDIQKIPEG